MFLTSLGPVHSALGTERWYQYGLKENYHVLEKFLEYSRKQHLAKKLWKPEEVRLQAQARPQFTSNVMTNGVWQLFAPSACEEYVL